MGARQSKRSVDITTTPKKDGLPVEGVVGDAAAPGDGKLEKIEEADAKPTTNGTAVHTDATPEDKEKDKDEATEKEKEKDDETKSEDAKVESPTVETPAEGTAEVTTPTEGTPASPTTATSPESKETKKKDKLKKKWSFRSISFGKKDKSKPAREDAPKNGDVTKEEPLTEGGEEAEAAASSPADEKSAVSSPTEKEQSETVAEGAAPAVPEAKVEEEENKSSAATAAPAAVASSPAEEKKEESSTPAPTPVPVEAKKVEENEKEVESANADKKVEVSPVQAVIEAPVEVISQSKQIATTTTTAPSIIERKTSEDFPSHFPSSPPPTPIDPSPLQHAQQVAENASAIAEALKLPAEAASKANISNTSDKPVTISVSASPTSSRRVETSSNDTVTLISEKSNETNSSESPEQTGNAFPLPITTTITETTTTTITALTDSIEKPSAIIEHTDLRVTEVGNANEVEIVTKDEDIVVSVETEKPLETDLVIQTEEGPAPVSGDIVFEAKPAVVIPDSPTEDVKSVEVLLEPETNQGNEPLIPEPIESTEGLIEKDDENIEPIQTVSEPIIPLTQEHSNNLDIPEKDVPPPLPDSPIPVPKATSQLLNFMSTQIEDSPVITEIIDSAKNPVLPTEEVSCPLPTKTQDISEINECIEEIEKSESHEEKHKDTSSSSPVPVEISDMQVKQPSEVNDDEDLPTAVEETLVNEKSCESHDEVVNITEITTEASVASSAISPEPSIPEIPTETTLLTPPRSPSPAAISNLSVTDVITKDSPQLEILGTDSNHEIKMESVEKSLNSYNDSELELKERLAVSMDEESTPVNCQLSNAVQENDQSKTEPEAPIENNVVVNNISTTEVNDEAPKSPPPVVPAEIVAPTLGPAITEDVASVTKAIEEIDINEKAVAAAVNEAIESVNTNEIIADMNHQNNMNE